MFLAIPIDIFRAIPIDKSGAIAIDIFRAIAIDIFRAIDMRMKGRQKRPPTSGSPGLTPGRELRRELRKELRGRGRGGGLRNYYKWELHIHDNHQILNSNFCLFKELTKYFFYGIIYIEKEMEKVLENLMLYLRGITHPISFSQNTCYTVDNK